jgi:hypothetical protein
VNPIVGTVKIQDQFLGCRLKTADKLFKEHLVHQPGFFASGTIFQSAQSRAAGQLLITFSCRLPEQILA